MKLRNLLRVVLDFQHLHATVLTAVRADVVSDVQLTAGWACDELLERQRIVRTALVFTAE